MAGATVEERLRMLEARQDALQRLIEERLSDAGSRKRGWQAIVGTFENDPLYDEAMRLGREWRQSELGDDTPESR